MAQGAETVLTVKVIHLEGALSALRKVISIEDDDSERGSLTESAARVANALRTTRTTLAELHRRQADLAAAALGSE